MMAVNLNSDQVIALQGFLQNAQYAAGYNYLRDVVNQKIPLEGDFAKSQDLAALKAWFDAAAHINANDGSFVSEFVRGSTEFVAESQGVTVTDQQFQTSSDTLAIKLLSYAIQYGSIPSAQTVVNEDIQNAVDTLHMPPWGWAGAITDFLPPPAGLGQDVASVPLDKTGVMSDAIQMGLIRSVDRMLRDGVISTAAEVKSMITATGHSVFDFLNTSGLSGVNLIPSLQTLFGQAEIALSPLVLDLNGNGMETISKATGIHFDLDGNGFAETTGWVAPNDGLLVWDRNGNGVIDNGTELFGNSTLLANGSKAANGFTALAELDTNGDGKIDSLDANFANLQVWKDANSNGITDAGELLAGIGAANDREWRFLA